MMRTILVLIALWSAFPSLAADVLAATAVQQSVGQFQTTVASVQSAVASSSDPRAVITANLSVLTDRARATAEQVTQFESRVSGMLESARFEELKFLTDYALSLIKGFVVPTTRDRLQALAAINQQIDKMSQILKQLVTASQRLAHEEQEALHRVNAACLQACVLPNATVGCSNGQCVVASCNAGWDNLDGIAANGCEAPARK